jgi:hypothetical protein
MAASLPDPDPADEYRCRFAFQTSVGPYRDAFAEKVAHIGTYISKMHGLPNAIPS